MLGLCLLPWLHELRRLKASEYRVHPMVLPFLASSRCYMETRRTHTLDKPAVKHIYPSTYFSTTFSYLGNTPSSLTSKPSPSCSFFTRLHASFHSALST